MRYLESHTCVKISTLEPIGLYNFPVMAVLEPVLVPPILMAFLANSLDTNILLRFLAELFLPNFLARSGDIELNPGPSSYRGISESVLFYVAKIITERRKIRSVGKRLGILPNEIVMYEACSDIEGTYQMLKHWKENSPAEEQLEYLTTALTGAACRDIAGILMPDDDHVQRTDANINAHQPAATATAAASVFSILAGAANLAVLASAANFAVGVARGIMGCQRVGIRG